MGYMNSYDFIYGSKVIVQCQDQINVVTWKGDIDYNDYLQIIKKDIGFFSYWCKLKSVVKCIIREPPEELLDEDSSQKMAALGVAATSSFLTPFIHHYRSQYQNSRRHVVHIGVVICSSFGSLLCRLFGDIFASLSTTHNRDAIRRFSERF